MIMQPIDKAILLLQILNILVLIRIVLDVFHIIIIPWNDEDLAEIIKRKGLKTAHRHKTLKELDADIHNYINGKYEEVTE